MYKILTGKVNVNIVKLSHIISARGDLNSVQVNRDTFFSQRVRENCNGRGKEVAENTIWYILK